MTIHILISIKKEQDHFSMVFFKKNSLQKKILKLHSIF